MTLNDTDLIEKSPLSLQEANSPEKLRKLEEQIIQDHLRIKELTSLNEELRAFSYSVSHDLRNPLNCIIACSEVLTLEIGACLDPDCRQALDYITKASDRMAQVIADLLILSNISQHEVRHERVNLSDMVKDFLLVLQASNPQRHVECDVEADGFVNADPGLLRILMENLLRNAWKYTANAEHPRIEFSSLEKEGRRFFYVRDNGVGFDMGDVGRLFKPYQRLCTQREFKGTGIGLAIVKRIIDRHGGLVYAEGVKNQGATIYFHIP